jgi:hypothetical protein
VEENELKTWIADPIVRLQGIGRYDGMLRSQLKQTSDDEAEAFSTGSITCLGLNWRSK